MGDVEHRKRRRPIGQLRARGSPVNGGADCARGFQFCSLTRQHFFFKCAQVSSPRYKRLIISYTRIVMFRPNYMQCKFSQISKVCYQCEICNVVYGRCSLRFTGEQRIRIINFEEPLLVEHLTSSSDHGT